MVQYVVSRHIRRRDYELEPSETNQQRDDKRRTYLRPFSPELFGSGHRKRIDGRIQPKSILIVHGLYFSNLQANVGRTAFGPFPAKNRPKLAANGPVDSG
jgi:hypothetical protein